MLLKVDEGLFPAVGPERSGARVLVTGAAGFLGTYVVETLQNAGYPVRAFIRRSSDVQSLPQHVEVAIGDVRNVEAVRSAAAGCGAVVHLAAKVHALDEQAGDQAEYEAINVEGTRNVLTGATAGGAVRVVFASTVKVFGEKTAGCVDESQSPNPQTPYARSKWEAEQLVAEWAHRKHLSAVSLRLPMVYGPTCKGNLFRMIMAIDRNRFPPLPKLSNCRSMLYVKNFSQAVLLVLRQDHISRPMYVVADRMPYSTSTVYDLLREGLGKPVARWRVPVWALAIGARGGDVLRVVTRRVTGFTTASLEKLVESAWYSPDALVRDLGYSPRYVFQDAVPELIWHYRSIARPC